jgi:hypothetical protein
MRSDWTRLSDEQLLAQCEVDTYRASGPGGQKRNKTSSAVRLRHVPSALVVIAEESRSQYENRARALRRLREALYLQVREPVSGSALQPGGCAGHPEVRAARQEDSRLNVGRKDPRYWPAAALVLDVLEAVQGRLRDAAAALAISTGNLVDFLRVSPKVWAQVHHLRRRFGHKPLRAE